MSPTGQDVREWARHNGYPEIADKGPIPAGARADWESRYIPPPTADADEDEWAVNDAEAEQAPHKETAPDVSKKRAEPLTDRASRVFKGAQAKAKATQRKPRSSRPRVPIDSILSAGWEILAGVVAKTGMTGPGYIMARQAPVAGMVLEDTVKDTALDKVLQPFARNAGRLNTVSALVGPPMIVAALQAQPDKAYILVPILRKMLGDWVEIAGPKFSQLKAKQEKFEAEFGTEVDEILAELLIAMGFTEESDGT